MFQNKLTIKVLSFFTLLLLSSVLFVSDEEDVANVDIS